MTSKFLKIKAFLMLKTRVGGYIIKYSKHWLFTLTVASISTTILRKKVHVNYCRSNTNLKLSRESSYIQSSSVYQLCLTLSNSMECNTPGFPIQHQFLDLAQTHVHRVGDAIEPSHPLPSASPPAFNLSQHKGLFQWVSSSHHAAKVLEFQLQQESLKWIFRIDFL